MEVEATETLRQAETLQNIFNRHRVLLEGQPTNPDGKVNCT